MKLTSIVLGLLGLAVLTGCVQYDRVEWVRTEPTLVEAVPESAEVEADLWWQALLTAPVEVVVAVADAPVAIIHEIGGLVRTIAGAVTTVETGRVREATAWTRISILRKDSVQWLDHAATPKLTGGKDEGLTEEPEVLAGGGSGPGADPEREPEAQP